MYCNWDKLADLRSIYHTQRCITSYYMQENKTTDVHDDKLLTEMFVNQFFCGNYDYNWKTLITTCCSSKYDVKNSKARYVQCTNNILKKQL